MSSRHEDYPRTFRYDQGRGGGGSSRRGSGSSSRRRFERVVTAPKKDEPRERYSATTSVSSSSSDSPFKGYEGDKVGGHRPPQYRHRDEPFPRSSPAAPPRPYHYGSARSHATPPPPPPSRRQEQPKERRSTLDPWPEMPSRQFLAEVDATTPAPTTKLTKYTAQFVDRSERTYDVITDGALFSDYVERGNIIAKAWVNPHAYLMAESTAADYSSSLDEDEVDLGPQLLNVALPPRRRVVDYADFSEGQPATGQITLTHRATRRRCVIHFSAGAFPERSRHGYLYCDRFIVYRDLVD
jgi:hypothetical protein